LILLLASKQRYSFMPPEDNDLGAEPLTPEELGLIRLWILQGAEGQMGEEEAIVWRPLPPSDQGGRPR
jgi:hypothetical protein